MKILVVVALSLSLFAASAQTTSGYHITKKIPVAGQGGWDYLTVDDSARRLYVSHGTQVEVLDVDSGAVVGKIANTPGVHGIAIAPELGRGFVFSGHVHNYERHEHGGITYFVSGGAGAHAYPIERTPGDPFQSKEVNYHYLQVEVDRGKLKVTMHRLDLTSGKAVWTEPDSVTISAPAAKAAAQGK